ncbi:MAG: hypothetical protein KAJ57_10010 [Woeseiaceae bacterium]|nr:hypothetical protein [Woeseiaceae bacterium]
MKNGLISLFSGLMLVLLTVPARADGLTQLWECELEEDKTRAELVEISVTWTKAASSIEGAEGLEAYLEFPVSGDVGDGEFVFVMTLPSATAWGRFEDAYPDSKAAEIDEDWGDVASCSESSIWSSVSLQ